MSIKKEKLSPGAAGPYGAQHTTSEPNKKPTQTNKLSDIETHKQTSRQTDTDTDTDTRISDPFWPVFLNIFLPHFVLGTSKIASGL